jgi:hypothetical protein
MRSLCIFIVMVGTFALLGCTHAGNQNVERGSRIDQVQVEAVTRIPPPPVPEVMDISAYMDDPLREGPSYGRRFTTRDERTGATVEVFPDKSFIATLPQNKGTFGRRIVTNKQMVLLAESLQDLGRGVQALGMGASDAARSDEEFLVWHCYHYWDDRKIATGQREWFVDIPHGK